MVASGVTAPSALIVIGMSPVVAGASRTVCGGPAEAFWDCALGVGAPLGDYLSDDIEGR